MIETEDSSTENSEMAESCKMFDMHDDDLIMAQTPKFYIDRTQGAIPSLVNNLSFGMNPIQ